MTEKELRDQVLLAIYNNQDKLNIDDKPFCDREGIVFTSDDQRNRVFKALKDGRYITVVPYESGDCFLRGITYKGVDYIENPPQANIASPISISDSNGVVVNLGSISGSINQKISINDTEVIKSFTSALEQLKKSDSFNSDEKEEIADALNDYKECIEKKEAPGRSIIRNLGKYATRLLELGETMVPIIQFAIDHKHIAEL